MSKHSKATINEVEAILANHGTVDDILDRYIESTKVIQFHEFERFNYRSKQLILRRGSQKLDIKKIIKNTIDPSIKFSLIIPIIINLFLLMSLNQYHGEEKNIIKIISYFKISKNTSIALLITSTMTVISHEFYSGTRGQLFVSAENSIKIRNMIRTTYVMV